MNYELNLRVMKKNIKYICISLLMAVMSVNAWGTTETFNFATNAWGFSTSTYDYGVYSNGSGKVVTCEYVKLQEYPSGTYNGIQMKVTSKENAVLQLPIFPGAVSKIEVYTISGSADEQYVDLYVDGVYKTYEELNGQSAPSTAATFNCSPAIAAGSVIELQNSDETILQISRVVVTHNGSEMPAVYKIEYVSDDEDKGLVSGPSYATVGETVEFNLYPKDGYTNDGVLYYDETYYGVYESLDPGVDEFTMPAYDITVYAYFTDETCDVDPTIGAASINGGSAFILTSLTDAIPVSSGTCSPGSNCSWVDYGFAWKVSGGATTNKVQVGTSGAATSWNGSVQPGVGTTPTAWVVGDTYIVGTYGKNAKTGATIKTGTTTSFVLRSITFNSNGGSSVGPWYVKSGGTYSAPSTPTKTGYDFGGWYTDDGTFENAVNWSSAVSENKTYYAKWTVHTHSLHWYKNADDADDLTGSYTDGNAIAYGTTITAPNTPTRTGYTFAGWSETSSGSTTTPVTSMPDADKTYYAQWTAHTYEVRFNGNHDDAEGSMDNQDFTYGVAQYLTSCGFTNEGYFFKGWATTNDGDVVYTNGQSVSNLTAVDEATVDLYAIWGQYEKYIFACAEISVASSDAGKALVTSSYHETNSVSDNINIIATNPIKVTVSGAVSGHRVTFTNSVGLHFYKKVEGTGGDAGKYKYIEATGANSFVAPLTAQEVYVSYQPTSAGTGAILRELPFTISCDGESQEFNTAGEYIKARNLPSSVAIVANVGGSWHGLSANITSSSTPKDKMIAVATEGGILKAYGPSDDFGYKLWPVRTVNSSYDRSGYTYSSGYPAKLYGDRLRFAGKDNKGLMANNNESSNKYNINNYGAITVITAYFEHDENYEWKVTTREENGQFVYTLQSDQTNNNRYLRLWNDRWGTYLDERGTEDVYILPLVETALVDMSPFEWGTDQVVVCYTPGATPVALTGVNMGSDAAASPTFTQLGTSDLWSVSGLTGMTDKPAQQLQVKITENGTEKQGLLQIPLIVDGTSTEAELRSSLPGANADARNKVAKNTDVVILSGGKMTTNTASGNFKDLYIYAGGKAIITNAMSFGDIYMRGGFGYIGDETWDVARAKIDAAVSLGDEGKLYYDLTIDGTKYYDLAVPYEVDLTATTDDKGDGDFNVWMKVYDGTLRANTGKGWTWYDWSGDLLLHPGTGYLIEATPRYNRSYCTIRFPMSPDLSSGEAEKDPFAVTAPGMNADGSIATGKVPNNVGWNFIANPYMCNFGTDDMSEGKDGTLKLGQLVEHRPDGVWDGTYEWDTEGEKNIRYVTTFDYNTQHYEQHPLSSTVLDPFTGFFVQIAKAGSLNFTSEGRQLSAPAIMLASQLPNDMELVLTVSGNGYSDETRLHINNELSLADAMEFPDEMTKQLNAGVINFYTIANGINMYANGMSYEDAQEWIPAGVVAPQEGLYAFSVSGVNANYIKSVLLLDKNSGYEYDLMSVNPQLFLNNGTDDERFAVKIVLREGDETPTGLFDVQTDNTRAIKFIYRDNMYILLNGNVYDATGKRVREINK